MDISQYIIKLLEEKNNHPKLDIGNRLGSTGYIDFITLEEVTSSIMWGLDIHRRPFIVLKLLIDGDIVLQTIFQRYTDKLYFWRGCGHGSPNPLLFDSDIDIGIPQLNLLLKVMKNETVRITQNHTYSDYIGKDVCLFDQEKWDATKVIQKNWRKCRYDPSYKMCENVLLHNLNDIYTKHNKEIFLE